MFDIVKVATHDQENVTSVLDQVICFSKLDRLYGEAWSSIWSDFWIMSSILDLPGQSKIIVAVCTRHCDFKLKTFQVHLIVLGRRKIP